MTLAGATFFAVAAVLTLALPRRLAVLPLLLSAAYIPGGEALDIGGANFTTPRLLIAVGLLRAVIDGEGMEGGINAVDRLVLLWGVLLIGTSAFHTSDAWIYRMGIGWSEMGSYFLARAFLRDLTDVRRVCAVLAVALLPLAIAMLVEKTTGFNAFSVFNGVNGSAAVREGHVRASGPFSHPILAGTVGAFCFGVGLSLLGRSRLPAVAGCAAGIAIVLASASSGPLLMLAFIAVGYLSWPVRNRMRPARWLLVIGLVALNAVMNDPVYFLMARVDLVGGSQGWFRAQLIRSSIEHLSEWWFAGTDYTRHWMQTGITVSSRHTDMTNHILSMGVMGGLPLMITFVAILAMSFRSVGQSMRRSESASRDERRLIWTLGALLVGFVMNFLSIALFDQSVTFFWFTVAAIGSVAATRVSVPRAQPSVEMRLPSLTVNHFAVRTKQPVLDRS